MEASRTPVVLTRLGCVVVALQPLPAIVTDAEALLFMSEGADELLSQLVTLAQEATAARASLQGADGPGGAGAGAPSSSFEGVMVAALLRIVEERTSAALRAITAQANGALSKAGVVEVQMQRVSSAIDAVDKFISDAVGVHKAVENVLENEEDLEALVLSVARELPPAAEGGGGGRSGDEGGGDAPDEAEENPAWRSELVATEETLEWFITSVDAALAGARLLEARLDSERTAMNLKLAINRNGLMRLQLSACGRGPRAPAHVRARPHSLRGVPPALARAHRLVPPPRPPSPRPARPPQSSRRSSSLRRGAP